MTLQVEADYDLLLALKTVVLLPSLLMRRMYNHFCCHAVVGNILMTRYFRVVMGEAAQHLLFQRLISCSFQVLQSCHPPALSASQDNLVLNFLYMSIWRQLSSAIARCQEVVTSLVSVSHFLFAVAIWTGHGILLSVFPSWNPSAGIFSFKKNVFCMQVPHIANASPTPTFLRQYSLSSRMCWAVVFWKSGDVLLGRREGGGIRYVLPVASIISVGLRCEDF